jgi:hypothetical protein
VSDDDRSARPRYLSGAALLGLAFAVGCTQLFWYTFIDEGDNIAVGTLIAGGQVLYRDLFSHHFPFAYYWVALVARCCGASILTFRLSILLFQTAAFAVAMWRTPFPLALGGAALVWRVIAPPYYGNMVIYHSFAGAALIPLVMVTLAIAGRYRTVRRSDCAVIGVCATIALLSDPSVALAVLLSLGVLASSDAGPTTAVQAAAVTAALLALYVGYLLGSATFGVFVSDVFRFNTEVYSKYTPVDPIPLRRIVGEAATLLHLFAPRWMHLSAAMPSLLHPDHWVLTGFLYRAAIIVAAVILLGQRKILPAVYLYGAAATLLATTGDERFRAIPLILIALFAAAWCVSGEWRGNPPHTGTERGHLQSKRRLPLGLALVSAARVSLAVMLGWLLIWGVQNLVASRSRLSYAANFGGYERHAAALRGLSCGRESVALVYYPSDPLMHFFTRMPPASQYMFMFPWVAEIGMSEVIRNLQSKLAVVSIDLDGQIWGRKNRQYLAALIDFLDGEYVAVAPGVYVSPALAQACPLP